MEVIGCIPLLLQFFLHLLSTYTDLLHLFFLNQSFSCFLQLVSSIFSSVGPFYVFHPLHVSLPSSEHIPQVILKHVNQPYHLTPFCCFLLYQHVHQLLCIPFVHQLYTAHHPHHRAFCSSQNTYFTFSQTPRFASI